MAQNQAVGRSSLAYGSPVIIRTSGSVVGQMEAEGPLGSYFDIKGQDKDNLFGADSWEKAESALQKQAIDLTLQKAELQAENIRYLFAGDLLGQNIASSFGVMDFNIPLFGLYGACSTCGESLCLGSMAIAAGYAGTVMCLTSSHYASAQKEFRYPLEYGGQRPLYATWTVTGSAAFILQPQHLPTGEREAVSSYSKKIAITGITPGKIVDYGIRDSFNMGCAMAPAACDTITWNLKDFGRKATDYDAIVTGDLGNVGKEALFKLLEEQKIDISDRYYDCGMLMYDQDKQDVHAGGSGCGCSATVLSAYLLRRIEAGEWNRILFVPTGALLNKTSFNEGQNVPGIAHGVVIEAIS